jgi:hypothetical protein
LNPAIKIGSAVLSVALLGAAVAIGGRAPLSPAKVADALQSAARNVTEAEANTAAAARSTRALATIARNVDSQVQSSRRMLGIQLRLERSSRRGASRAADLGRGIDGITDALLRVRRHLETLAGLSSTTVAAGERSAAAGDDVDSSLATLRALFQEVIHESRELNRKARGYQRLRDGP